MPGAAVKRHTEDCLLRREPERYKYAEDCTCGAAAKSVAGVNVEDVRAGGGDNVYVVVTRHDEGCALLGAVHLMPGEDPDQFCTCGASRDKARKRTITTHNIVTTDGRDYYAQRGAAETPTNTFDAMTITTAQNTPDASSNYSDLTTIPTGGEQSIDGSYPTTNDSDADNPGTTGTNTVTWRASYGTSEGNGTIVGVAIHNASASGTDPLLNHAAFSSSWVKTSADTATVYVNHTFGSS